MAQRITPLEVYAGLDVNYTATGAEAALHLAVSQLFNKLEAVVSYIQPKTLA